MRCMAYISAFLKRYLLVSFYEYDNCENYKGLNLEIVVCISLCAMILFHDYIFSDAPFFLYENSDLARANLPTYMMLYDLITSEFGFWSWRMGSGTSIFSHADCFFDPFTYIILSRGRDNIANMMAYSFIIKIICEGIAISYYLRSFKISRISVVFGSILYAFSGYSIIMGSNLVFGTILVYFPLLLLAMEKRIDNKTNKWVLIVLALIAVYSYYFFYISSGIAVIYLLIRSVQKHKRIIIELANFIFLDVLAFALGAFALLPQFYITLSTSRLNDGKDVLWNWMLFRPDLKTVANVFARFASVNMLGDIITTRYYGVKDYFQCESFTTALFFPLTMHWLHTKYDGRKVKIYLLVLAGCLLLFPLFSFAMNAFSTINYRWIFLFHTFSAVICAFSLDEIILVRHIDIDVLSKKGVHFFHADLRYFKKECCILGITTIVIMLICLYKRHIGRWSALQWMLENSQYLMAATAICVCFYFILATYNKKARNHLRAGGIGLAILLLLIFEQNINYSKWLSYNEGVYNFEDGSRYGYDDHSMAVINKIKKADTEWYRIYKDFDSVYDRNFIPSDNDAMVQDYFGLKNYNSTNNKNVVKFLQAMGVWVACYPSIEKFQNLGIHPSDCVGQDLNYINGIDEKYKLLNLYGVKYYIVKDDQLDNIPYWMIENKNFSEGDIHVFENSERYSLAFSKNQYISEDDFLNLTEDERYELIQSHIVVNNGDLQTFMNATDISNIQLENFTNDILKFRTNSKGAQGVTFSIPYDQGWHIFIDGIEADSKMVDMSLLGCVVPEGQHDVVLQYVPAGMKEGIIISSIALLLVVAYFGYRWIYIWRFSKGASNL